MSDGPQASRTKGDSMKKRTLTAGVAAVIAATTVLAVTAWPASAHQTRTIHFFEAFKNSVGGDIDANDTKSDFGDYSVFHTQLRDREGGKIIGHNNAVCLHGSFRDYCQATFVFNNRGMLMSYGLGSLSDKPHIDHFAIIGGVGEFIGASGQMQFDTNHEGPNGVNWTVTLTD
jgi:hypothetical protein